jgi:anti-sigma regulatory factor (Ser/Thr protein kinase)
MRTRDFQLSRGLLLRLELHSNPHLLCVVRGAVERLAQVLGFSARGCRSVTRAVDEALTNIIRHSYCGRLDEPIAMYFRRVPRSSNGGGDGGLEVQLWDRGLEFDPAKVRSRRQKEIRSGGLGLHFIRHAMDSVEYTRVGRTNRLRLVKYFAGREGPSG